MLVKSCAMPPAIVPRVFIFCDRTGSALMIVSFRALACTLEHHNHSAKAAHEEESQLF
jgi:hypothetical protein